LLAIVSGFYGCAVIDYRAGPVPGLEHMTVEEHYIGASEIHARCARCGTREFESPLACTCINFATNHAVIWLPANASPSTIEHERAHAAGYDHTDGELRRRYQSWQASGRSRVTVNNRGGEQQLRY
jgi:hypothetical protein